MTADPVRPGTMTSEKDNASTYPALTPDAGTHQATLKKTDDSKKKTALLPPDTLKSQKNLAAVTEGASPRTNLALRMPVNRINILRGENSLCPLKANKCCCTEAIKGRHEFRYGNPALFSALQKIHIYSTIL